MEYFLLATLVFLSLGIIWGMLGFGIRSTPLIRNEKIVGGGLAICMLSCTVSWSIWIIYAFGFIVSKGYSFIVMLM